MALCHGKVLCDSPWMAWLKLVRRDWVDSGAIFNNLQVEFYRLWINGKKTTTTQHYKTNEKGKEGFKVKKSVQFTLLRDFQTLKY